MKNLLTSCFLSAILPAVLLMCAAPVHAQTLAADGINAEQQGCFHTTGRGNRTPVVRIKFTNNSGNSITLRGAGISLSRNAARNVSRMALYATTTSEFFAAHQHSLIVSKAIKGNRKAASSHNDSISLNLAEGSYIMPQGELYLWLTADIKTKATLGDSINAEISALDLNINGRRFTIVPEKKATPYASHGIRIYDRQQFVFVPTDDSCRYYRIPAMTLNAHGDIIIAADRRYNSLADLGKHKIDVSIRRSKDGGKTWTPQQLIAVGDGTSDDKYGYGDASLVRTKSGRLLCLMAASSRHVFAGIRHIALCVSDDGGQMWTAPRDITRQRFTDAAHNKHDTVGFHSLFCTSGRALCTADGTIMTAAACLDNPTSRTFDNYILSSSDNGDSWTIAPERAFVGGDEAKLAQMNDGTILISVRRQTGNRGFNRADRTATHWQKQYDDQQMPSNACNTDILYYSRKTEGKPDIMLHTGIISPSRHGLRLWMSIDEGLTWHPVCTIQHGGAAYSTMEKLKNGDLAILYEDNSYDAGNAYHINFLTLTKQQINAFYKQLRRQSNSTAK